MTYDNTPEIREMYDWMSESYDREWNYCLSRTDDQKNGTEKKGERYKGKELFLLNYDSQEIQVRYQELTCTKPILCSHRHRTGV